VAFAYKRGKLLKIDLSFKFAFYFKTQQILESKDALDIFSFEEQVFL
jgi:hypothetical protein